MAMLLWQRDIASDAAGVKATFSSWDQCMSKAYCKWPVIIGILIGSLILLSLVWCLARCLCCGAECCCGCLACCNSCCPSPRKRNAGNQQPPPQQPYQQPNQQYQPPAAPMYAGGGYRGPQTATFDAPSKGASPYNEDALPAMPSWENATSKRVENEDVEMEKLNNPHQAQQQSLLPTDNHMDPPYPASPQGHHDYNRAGDFDTLPTSPYHNYDQHQQYAPSPVSTAYGRNSAYPPPSHYLSPTSTVYEPSTYPPSYHTAPPSVANPPPQQGYGAQLGRKPVQGSWRDV